MKTINFNSAAILITCIITIIFAYISINSWISSLTASHELISIDSQYVGRDFIFFYAAAKEIIINNVHNLYDNYYANETTSAIFPELGNIKLSNWIWLYPPHYLLLLAPLGFLPYYPALIVWLTVSVLLILITLRYFWDMKLIFLLITILNINIFICLIMGQNTLILATVTGIGIASIQKRPWLAAICFSIVSMKPHFAILIPIALMLGKYWQVLFYTIITTLFLVALSSYLFGWNVYLLAAEHLNAVQNYSLTDTNWFFSAYSTYRALLDMDITPYYSWLGYCIVTAVALYYFQNIWRKNHSPEDKWLALGIASLLCTPYNLVYDSVIITLPIMVRFSLMMNNKQQSNILICLLVILQIFAFAIVLINKYLAILLIISALAILYETSSKKIC